MRSDQSPAGAGESWSYAADPPAPGRSRLGISLSGGGIRAATFALGVQQQLAEAGYFRRAHYLSAVSGGSYLAAGLAASHALCPEELRGVDGPQPWEAGSREEARLRRHLSYLAEGGTGRMWLIANLLYGLGLNLLPLVVGAFLAGRVTGRLLAEIYPHVGRQAPMDTTALPWSLGLAALAVLLACVAVGLRRFGDKPRQPRHLGPRRAETAVMAFLSAAVVVLFGLVLLPALVHALARYAAVPSLSGLGLDLDTWRSRLTVVAVLGLGAAIVAGGLALWMLRARRFALLRGILAAIAGGSLLVVPFLMASETAAAHTVKFSQELVVWGICLGVLLVFAIWAHNRRYSMHLFYRERIQDAFITRRTGTVSHPGLSSVPYAEPVCLSTIAKLNAQRGNFPELVICAAVAARGTQVPTKARAASFTFEGERSGNWQLRMSCETSSIEDGDFIGGGGITLPSMVAISGAAISPLMGRFTLPAYRFLMAMLNVRLGVWLRHPSRPKPAIPSDGNSRLAKIWGYLVRGWREPGAWYVLKEGLGLASARAPYIYVSDGGHWENLGLVELLRRRCTQVVVVDASGAPGLADVGRALAIARAELGIEFSFDPLVTDATEGSPQTPVAVGTFCYPDGEEGYVFYARSVLWSGAPIDLHLFAERNGVFPRHPTANQFLTGEVFDAYKALGSAVGRELVAAMRLPPESQDESRPLSDAE